MKTNHYLPLASLLIACTATPPGDINESNSQTETTMEITITDYATDPAIESQTKAFLKALNTSGGQPMETMAATDARKVLEGAQTSVTVDMSGVEVSDKTITQDGLTVKLFVMKPAGTKEDLPAFMFFHGGGWVIGDFPTHQRFIRDLVVSSGAAAVHVEYSLSPEAKYPVALNECFAATKWVAANGKEIGVDGSRLAVVGNSAGGNLTAAVALKAKVEHGPELRFQLLFWPVTDANLETASYNEFAEDRFLTKNMMRWFWNHYSEPSQREEIYLSPLQASLDDLKGLPPTLVQTAENDVLRDEGEAYARKLNEAGVPVSLVRYQGMIHDYGLLNPLAGIPEIQSALRHAGSELKNALK